MPKRQTIQKVSALLPLILALTACTERTGRKSAEVQPPRVAEVLIGSWTASAYIPPDEAKAMFGNEPGVSAEMTINGISNYHMGGKGDSEGELTLRLMKDGEEIPLKFMVRATGTWEVHGNDTLVETIAQSSFTPLNAASQALLTASPELESMLKPLPGTSSSSTVTVESDSVVRVRSSDTKLVTTLQRRS